MTCRDSLNCLHEPFGDAFYYGPERLSERYENSEQDRIDSGFNETTYKAVFDRIARESDKGKRLFIKDITHYLVPPNGAEATIAPSLFHPKKGVGTTTNGVGAPAAAAATNGAINGHPNAVSNGDATTASKPYPYATEAEPNNPTVVPRELLSKFHFTFLIRHPRSSIPSYFRCTVPPLDKVTGFYHFMPSEAGYDEVRRVFDYLRSIGEIGPNVATRPELVETNGAVPAATSAGSNDENKNKVDICVIDADDLLDNPSGIIAAYCESVGFPYDPGMLTWDTPEDHEHAQTAFAKWHGFHNDAIDSTSLRARTHAKKAKSVEAEDAEWKEKYGDEGARIIRETVDKNVADYEYLKQWALKV
ncbi:MAG: hypothetical protein M1825_004661 [Sarcosagium campestre]|nr:MAG: hypothetical protein M1825_004661 [Sarcosagium campestre]